MNNYRAEKTTPEEQKGSRRVQNRSTVNKFSLVDKDVQATLCHRKISKDPTNLEDENVVKDKKKSQKSDLSTTLNQVMSRIIRPDSASSSCKEESKCVINKDVDTLLRSWGLIVGDHIKIKEDANTREGELSDESLLQEKSQARERRNAVAWESWYAKKKEAARREEEFDKKKIEEKHKQDVQKETKHLHERQQSCYEHWLLGQLKSDPETENLAAEKSQNTEEETKIVMEKRREQRKEEFERSFHACTGKKRNRHLDEKHVKEEAVQQQEADEKEHKEQCQRAFEEWKLKSANKPKPMLGKVYDPQAHCRITANMFINPNPWTRNF